MKKLLTLAAAFVICTNISAQNNWSIGATVGSFGNHSVYSGGMQNANALFNHNPYGSGMIGVVFRKTLSPHWSVQTGLNFSSMGFEYAMAKNYSLMQPKDHFMVNNVSMGLTTIPATLIWNFNPNCKNVRWFVGAGLSLVGHSATTNAHKNVDPTTTETANTGMSSTDYLNQTVTASSFLTVNGHLMVGVEKLFKKGTMLSLAAYFNRGFAPLATSTVSYSVNGQLYNHSFTNYNNFGGLTLTYYFKPFKGKAVTTVVK